MNESAEIRETLHSAKRVLLASHVPPDGDGLGAGLALLRRLRASGTEAIFAAGGPVQECLRFLYDADEVDETPEGPAGDFDVVVALDSGALHRLGGLVAKTAGARALLNIDHHATNDLYGTLNLVDPAAPATGEIVYRLFKDWGVEITEDVAMPLYVALMTDTGRFAYSNTTPAAHRMAADLIAAGVRPDRATDHVYRSVPPGYLRLTGLAIGAIEILAGGRVAHLTVTEEMVALAGADPLDVGDLVDLIMSMAGVEVGVLLREASPGPGTKLSLRSRRWFSVNEFAARYGGGGHARAAGAVLPEPLDAARERLLGDLLPAFEAAEEEER